MDRFEYYTYIYDLEGFGSSVVNGDVLDAELNELGAEGWELVSTAAAMEGVVRCIVYTFKRKL